MSINRSTDKEDVVHIYSGILLSHKKEWNNAIFSGMDANRDITPSEVSQTERQMYNITYMGVESKIWHK